MKRAALILLCLLSLAGTALAQTSSSGSSSSGSSSSSSSTSTTVTITLPYTGLEGVIYYGSMTPEQQNFYNGLQVYANYSTQVLTAATYSNAEKKLRNGEVLTAYESSILSRGPLPVTSGNQAFVPVGGSTSSSTSK